MACTKILTTPTFLGLVHAHFVGMHMFESVRMLNQSFSTTVNEFTILFLPIGSSVTNNY